MSTLPIIERRDKLVSEMFNQPGKFFLHFTDGRNSASVRGADDKKTILDQLGEQLLNGDIVLWEPTIFDAAVHGHELYYGVEVKPAIMPIRSQLWFLDQSEKKSRFYHALDVERKTLSKKNPDRAVSSTTIGMALAFLPKGIVMGEEINDKVPITDKAAVLSKPIEFRGYFFVTIMRCKVDVSDKDEILLVISPINTDSPTWAPLSMAAHAALDFMSQEFITHAKHPYNPSRVRFPERFKYRSMVETLMLRKRIIVEVGQRLDAETEELDKEFKGWNHCWTQRPYRRQQMTKQGKKVVFVRACIKGDTTKPMLPPRERVVHVRR